MKKIFLYILLFLSLSVNLFYLNIKLNDKRHKDELLSLFEVKNISYQEGFIDLNKKITDKKLQKSFYVIQIWDTTFLEFGEKIPYILNADSICKNTKNVQCFLLSSMYDESIEKCLEERNIHFNNFSLINDMGDYISGVCHLKKRKEKPSCATLIIKQQGDILYYNDKPINHLDKDSIFLNILHSLK
jgi:hypothetical protein